MMQQIRSMLAAGMMAGALSLGASAASALPLVDTNVAVQSDSTPKVDKVWYRCGYYRCRRYGYYRPYYRRYGYYRPYRYYGYGYRPFIGVGIGGFGVRLF